MVVVTGTWMLVPAASFFLFDAKETEKSFAATRETTQAWLMSVAATTLEKTFCTLKPPTRVLLLHMSPISPFWFLSLSPGSYQASEASVFKPTSASVIASHSSWPLVEVRLSK